MITENKERLLRIADDCDRMADQIEKLGSSDNQPSTLQPVARQG